MADQKEYRIVLVSDNHGDRKSLQYLGETYPEYDYFIHCGDSEMPAGEMDGFICVEGNNDFGYHGEIPLNQVLAVGKHRIYICHGHMDFLSYFHYEPMVKRAVNMGCDIVFFGHVHTYYDEVLDGVRLLNPGSIRHNRDGSPPSYMLVHIRDDDIDVMHMTYGSHEKKEGWFARFLKKLT